MPLYIYAYHHTTYVIRMMSYITCNQLCILLHTKANVVLLNWSGLAGIKMSLQRAQVSSGCAASGIRRRCLVGPWILSFDVLQILINPWHLSLLPVGSGWVTQAMSVAAPLGIDTLFPDNRHCGHTWLDARAKLFKTQGPSWDGATCGIKDVGRIQPECRLQLYLAIQ